MSPKLCLGTVQFGLPYGITNKSGQVDELEVKNILADASKAGFSWLDSAQAYGDAESVIGRNLPVEHNFQLVSKLPAQRQSIFTANHVSIWEQSLQLSLSRLGISCLDSLLLHSTDDLRKPGAEFLKEWLFGLKERGLVRRLGVSIYEACDLGPVDSELLDLVQLPLSLYDQRLLQNGTITYLRSQGCLVHARSLYLQGLLLTPADRWPSWIDQATRDHHTKLEAFAAGHARSLLECALDFARVQQELDGVVLGVCSRAQLDQLLKAWVMPPFLQDQGWHVWSIKDSFSLDPRRWPR